MIKFIEKDKIINPKNKYLLLIDNKTLDMRVRNFTRNDQEYINLNIPNLEMAKLFLEYKFEDFPNLYYLSVPIRFSKNIFFERIYIQKNFSHEDYEIKYRYSSDVKIWENRNKFLRFNSVYTRFVSELNYSQSKFAKKYQNTNLKPLIKSLSHKTLAFEISFKVKEISNSLGEEFEYYSNILNKYHFDVIKIIEGFDNYQFEEEIGVFKSAFNFPTEIKSACVQYLTYFTEFLADAGIKTTSSLDNDSGKVMFSIAPTDDIDALDKIREAITIYLNLPASPIVYDDSFAAMRLQQQIENLQHSRKMAARELQLAEKVLVAQSETIQEKNLIISQKDSTIEQQNKIIEKITSKSIMMDSLENKEEFVEIFEGLEIGESKLLKEHLGIKFNPAKSLKTLGNKIIKKDEKLTSIDIDVKNED